MVLDTDSSGKIDTTSQAYMDTIANKLKTLQSGMSSIMGSISCPKDSPCFIKEKNKVLKSTFNATKQNMEMAPLELSLAEKNMYEYNNGVPGGDFKYQRLIVDRFAQTAQELEQNSIEKQQEFMTDLIQALRQYQGEQLFAIRTEELLKTRQQEKALLLKKLDLYKKILHTSQRKVTYEDQDASTGYMYRRVLLFFYYGAIICYIIFGNFIPDKLYVSKSVWLVIVIACIIPVLLNILIKWIFIIGDVIAYWFKNDMPYRDVYSDLKESTNYYKVSPGSGIEEAPLPPPLQPLGTPISGSTTYNTLGVAAPPPY